MASIKCKACGRRYSYHQSDLCPHCGAYNKPGSRMRVDFDQDGNAELLHEQTFLQQSAAGRQRKDCYERKECHEGAARQVRIPGLNNRKRTIITRTEQSYGRVPLAGLCRLFISVYVPGAGLPGARASASPAPHGLGVCPDRAAYSAPAIDTHKAQCRWPWPFPPANTQWHWIPRP